LNNKRDLKFLDEVLGSVLMMWQFAWLLCCLCSWDDMLIVNGFLPCGVLYVPVGLQTLL